jgi:hypothetical protein
MGVDGIGALVLSYPGRLTLCALAVAGAVAMILELEHWLGRLIHISPTPMQQAAHTLSQEEE